MIRNGATFRDKQFSLHVQTNSINHPRLAVVVSRRVSTKAVVRNRIKRLVRESFRHQHHALNGIDIVVIAQHQAGDSPRDELRRSLRSLWSNVQARCVH